MFPCVYTCSHAASLLFHHTFIISVTVNVQLIPNPQPAVREAAIQTVRVKSRKSQMLQELMVPPKMESIALLPMMETIALPPMMETIALPPMMETIALYVTYYFSYVNPFPAYIHKANVNLYFILDVNIKYMLFSILYGHINVPMAFKELNLIPRLLCALHFATGELILSHDLA